MGEAWRSILSAPGAIASNWPASARQAALGLAGTALVAFAALGVAAWALPHGRPILTLAVALTGIAVLWLLDRVRRLALEECAERGELKAADEILNALLRVTGNGVIVADPDLKVRLFNPAAEMVFGRLGEETLGLSVQSLVPDLTKPGQAEIEPGEDPSRPRVRELRGRRGDEEPPLRLLLRDLVLPGGTWLLILVEDETETRQAEARLDYLERHDALTGLANRQAFEQAIRASAADPVLAGTPHALCLIDLDRFKTINDSCGHAAGDKLLCQVARILSTKLSDAVCLARLGADELAALFAGESAARAAALCEDVLRTLRTFPFTWGERSWDLSASAGLVELNPVQGAAKALGQAEIACGVAKSLGGDRLHLYDSADSVSLSRQGDLELIAAVGSALSEGRFHAIAQPIRSLKDPHQPPHYEVLVRMRDDRDNPVSPDRFIPAAERYILMPAVDRWILSHLIELHADRLKAWHASYPGRFLFALNLSATTLMDESFLPFLRRRFEDFGVPFSSVCFEITETAAVADLDRARTFMETLCDLGCGLAVDDFGTGFASYSYLKTLPVRYLKIDGSFVRNLLRDPVDRALTESINHIGQVLGLETIAEWAETPDLVEALRVMGVDYAQGYGVGHPVALDRIPPFGPDSQASAPRGSTAGSPQGAESPIGAPIR